MISALSTLLILFDAFTECGRFLCVQYLYPLPLYAEIQLMIQVPRSCPQLFSFSPFGEPALLDIATTVHYQGRHSFHCSKVIDTGFKLDQERYVATEASRLVA